MTTDTLDKLLVLTKKYARIDYEEGSRIVQDWVETAMALDADEIRQLELLILMQESTLETPTGDPSRKVA